MSDLEKMDGKPRSGSLPVGQHTPIINEYGGSGEPRRQPDRADKERLCPAHGTNVTAEQRLPCMPICCGKPSSGAPHRITPESCISSISRAAIPGVLYRRPFPGCHPSQARPAFRRLHGRGIQAAGVYINFFQRTLPTGGSRSLPS